MDVVDGWAESTEKSRAESWQQKAADIESGQLPKLQLIDMLIKLTEEARTAVPQGFEEIMTEGSGTSIFCFLGLMTYCSRSWILQELAFASKARIHTRYTTLARFMDAMIAWKAIYDANQQLISPVVWNALTSKWQTTDLAKASGMYSSKIKRM